MNHPEHIVIIGASLAGLRAAEQLRREKFAGTITLLGDEKHLPYDRPPLSKDILTGKREHDAIGLRRRPYEALELNLRLGERAKSLDDANNTIVLESDERLAYDILIIATGTSARPFPGVSWSENILAIRTLDDALAVKAKLQSSKKVLVLGAGFIGCEVASSARAMDCDVDLVDAADVPMLRGLGRTLGKRAQEMIEKAGVELHMNQLVDAIEENEQGVSLTMKDGSRLEGDMLVVGIGAVPNTTWLEASGLTLENGIATDASLRTQGANNIYAVGDVVRFNNQLFGETMRLEHWTHAVESAKHVAKTIVHGSEEVGAYLHVPNFWTDQFETKIQGAGWMKENDEMHFACGDENGDKFGYAFSRDGIITGFVSFNMPPKFIASQKLIANKTPIDEALETLA